MIEQIRGQGSDDLHFRSGGKRLDPEERLPIYLLDYEPDELEPDARAARERIIEGCATEADAELDEGCSGCGDRHRPDFSGDCRNDFQSFTEMEPHWEKYGIEPDYVCRGNNRWVNRITLHAALAADGLGTDAPPEARRTAARKYLLDVRSERGYPIPTADANG
ncbi:MAG: hypothetical protein F4X11_20740 [Acidobacteria bacterium]|nr:hypothetical protein [Acidobacteriota bacterium]